MTREDAERAAATFEFPPFKASVCPSMIMTFADGRVVSPDDYSLLIIGPSYTAITDDTQWWLREYAYYAEWQRRHPSTRSPGFL